MQTWFPQIDSERCTGCGACVMECPTNALALLNQRAYLQRPEQCNYCALCEACCPSQAIQLPYLVCFSPNLLQEQEETQ